MAKYINPVDTHDWEDQLGHDGKWNLNSVCRRCKCELMPAFMGISEEGTSPCPGWPVHAALSEANAAPVPPHDPSGVISDPLSSGDSEMQGRLPRGEEFVPDERGAAT